MNADPQPVTHRDHALRCPICAGERFTQREYVLRTVEDELFKQPWAADQMTAFVCGDCRHVLWFA